MRTPLLCFGAGRRIAPHEAQEDLRFNNTELLALIPKHNRRRLTQQRSRYLGEDCSTEGGQ